MSHVPYPLAFVALFLLGACSPASKKEPEPPHAATVGIHSFEFVVPKGWKVLETGLGPTLRTDQSAIAFEDLGPCTPEGFRRTLRGARDLYRAGRFDDSRELLGQLSLKQLVPVTDERRSFENAWARVRFPDRSEYGARPEEIEPAYEKFFDQVDRLPASSIEELAVSIIKDLSQDGTQETTNSESRTVDGKPAVVVDMWDRLTHTMGRRYLLLIHDDNLFLMKSVFGDTPELEGAFDQVLPSLVFVAGRP